MRSGTLESSSLTARILGLISATISVTSGSNVANSFIMLQYHVYWPWKPLMKVQDSTLKKFSV